jgi:AcrR family transcriptional regulator
VQNEYVDPRVTRTRERVLAAARDLLADEGQAAVTPTRLAEETGVSRSTIYRNWSDPAEIVLAAIADEGARPPFEPTGDPRTDLTEYLKNLRNGLGMPHTTLLATRIERAEHDPEADETMRATNAARRKLMADILGQIPDEFADAHALVVGPLFFQRFLAREPITDELIGLIVDAYLATRPV